ncbi:TraB/GumN family protein [Coralliovum pocilloporae]|uniref:TraB/GumN family protein n=1 Tax=Coralliovum pocilloporae TaxID=3066369 RepID=UPI003307BDF2
MRLIGLAIGLVAFLGLAPVEGQAQSAPSCPGDNLIDALKTDEPDKYRVLRASADAIPNGKGLVWQVTSPSGAISYLVGTIHVGPKLVPDLPEGLARVWSEVDGAAFELKEVADPAAMLAASFANLGKLLLPEGDSLRNHLTAGEILVLEQVLKDKGQALDYMHRFQPVYVATSLSLPSCGRALTPDQVKSSLSSTVDARIAARITEAGRDVYGLETPAEQFQSLVNLPLDDQLVLLRSTLALVDKLDDISITMTDIYRSEETALFWSWNLMLAEESGALEASKAFYNSLLDGRNHRMAERAQPYLEKGRILVAVGALHLPGEKGLVALLRARGFTVERLK